MKMSKKNLKFLHMLAAIDTNNPNKCPYLESFKKNHEEKDLTAQNVGDYFEFLAVYWDVFWKHRKKISDSEFRKVLPDNEFKKITS